MGVRMPLAPVEVGQDWATNEPLYERPAPPQTFDRTGRLWLDADPPTWAWPVNEPHFPEVRQLTIFDQERSD